MNRINSARSRLCLNYGSLPSLKMFQRLGYQAIETDIAQGDIIAVIFKKGEKRYGVHSRKYAYVIILSIVVNEQEHIIESENFYSDPSKYITTGDKIKVFYYNNKFYPEFVYEKNKNHKQSKDRASI